MAFSLTSNALRTCNVWKLSPSCSQVRFAFKRPDTPGPDPDIMKLTKPEKRHPEQEVYPGEYNLERPYPKTYYDKKPVKILLEEGKLYSWCSCGLSKCQPMCDGAHKTIDMTRFTKISPKFRPIRFRVETTKEYWLCNCKHSSKRPFCDGTHRKPEIQEAVRS